MKQKAKKRNFEDKEWNIEDITEEMAGAFALSIQSHFEELEDTEEVCMMWLNDIHIESQVENANLIKNAPSMYRLLKDAESYLPIELKKRFERICRELDRNIF